MYKQRRKPTFPRPQRLIAVDLETNTILQVVRLDFHEEAPTEQCILEHRSFYPRYGWTFESDEERDSVSLGYVHQELHKVKLFITNKHDNE